MMPPTSELIKSVEVVITITCLSTAGIVVLLKVVMCEFIDSLYDVRERRDKRRREFEERRKGAGA